MILRRVIQHVRDQNWTAIGIDFVIVVLGVFVATEVSDWNTARATEARAAVFTERLIEDLLHEAWFYEFTIEYNRDVLANAEVAVAALSGDASISDEAFVIAAYRASQTKSPLTRRSTYDELVSTGEIGLIADDTLRATANTVFNSTRLMTFHEVAAGSEYRALFRRLTPTDVQRALLRSCGDRLVEVGDYEGIDESLDYDCTLSLPPSRIAETASALRASEALLPALNVRFADTETVLQTLTQLFIAMRSGLQRIAGRED